MADMLFFGGISGALDPDSKEAQEHAERYYNLVRSMKTDVRRIAQNTGYSEQTISQIKRFIFLERHDLGDEKIERFAACYEMAASWQRLIDGKDIQKHDLTLLKHEIMERGLMLDGMSQHDAHIQTSRVYNYTLEAEEYYDSVKKHSESR